MKVPIQGGLTNDFVTDDARMVSDNDEAQERVSVSCFAVHSEFRSHSNA